MMSNLKSIWLLCPKSGKAKVFCRGHLNCQSCLWTSHKFSPSLHNAEENTAPPPSLLQMPPPGSGCVWKFFCCRDSSIPLPGHCQWVSEWVTTTLEFEDHDHMTKLWCQGNVFSAENKFAHWSSLLGSCSGSMGVKYCVTGKSPDSR